MTSLRESPPLNLAFALQFKDLYAAQGLIRLDKHFMGFLRAQHSALARKLAAARQTPCLDLEESQLILELVPYVEAFLGLLFGVAQEINGIQQEVLRLAAIASVKKLFVQRRAVKRYPEAQDFDGQELFQQLSQLLGEDWTELAFAEAVLGWMANEPAYQAELDLAGRYAAWAVAHLPQSVLFKLPQKIEGSGSLAIKAGPSHRDGFNLTDPGFDNSAATDQSHYCLWCHHRAKDSCSKGLHTTGKQHSGCPLEQKISEMNQSKAEGFTLGALAIVMIDNPLVAATGHRICNDCMKSCIFQKQEPVNIPATETQILRQVLDLPWGFEIYSLLTRWNPLNFRQALIKKRSPYKVLVAGMGPAGFTLAHYLLNQGHSVVGIDGLKIEPLEPTLSGISKTGQRRDFTPIYRLADIIEPLQQRKNWGFGGVAEYGITVRWDKNFLKIIRLLLERRSNFLLFDGVRFGSTLNLAQALHLGFDHVALCLGAGKPKVLPLKNGLAKGVRQASDFLMALQLTGANRWSSLAKLVLRLPVVVIGGGLTAIDTATEALAYYPLQVEKFYRRYQEVGGGVDWGEEDQQIAQEFLAHGQAIIAERANAQAEGRPPHFRALLQSWGGVTMVYRRYLSDSPAYTLNREEVVRSFAEGISLLEQAVPEEVLVDHFGAAKGLLVRLGVGQTREVAAKSILIAAGTSANNSFDEDELAGSKIAAERVSFFGELQPSFAGSVVKAMASAKKGYPVVEQSLKRFTPSAITRAALFAKLNRELRPVVAAINRLTPEVIEVVVHAPMAARAWQPGQFYRFQNYETLAQTREGTSLAMESLALSGTAVDVKKGLVALIVLERGNASRLCARLTPGEPVVLMGPTGQPSEIPSNQKVLLVGGGLGNAILFSIGKALKAKGSQVLYFAAYRSVQDRFKAPAIEAAADQVVWCSQTAPGFRPDRPQDISFIGAVPQALTSYAQALLQPALFAWKEFDRLLVIGPTGMMEAVAQLCANELQPKPGFKAFAGVNSPMQCMMKGICAQCLQRHVDPLTGQETIVYSCATQDQELQLIDFACLHNRLQQNQVQEALNRQWLASAV